MRTACIGLAALAWLLAVPLACLYGPMDLGTGEVLRLLAAFAGWPMAPAPLSGLDPAHTLVVTQIRLPRVLLALCVGGGLAVAGTALQGVLRNPLADPFILGLSAGAACGASVAIAFGGTLAALLPVLALPWVQGVGLVAPAAMLGAFAALAMAVLLGQSAGGLRRDTIILAGVAVSAFLGALVALIKTLDEESVAGIVFWLMGSFQGRGWAELPVLLAPMVPGLIIVGLHWRELDVLMLGDEEAAHLGVAVRRSRLWLLCGAGCITAGCVAVAGIIGFVGLVAPHVLRRWLGAGHGLLLPGAWCGGGLLLVWADVLARGVLSEGRELPVGVVTALLGGPFFAWIVRRRAVSEGTP